MVLALVLVGGHNENSEHSHQLTETQSTTTPGTSRILRDPAVLYQTGDRVSLMAALEHLAGSGTEPFEPVADVASATDAPLTEALTMAATEPTLASIRTPAPVPQLVHTPDPEPPSQAAPAFAAIGALISGHATSYGASYNGYSMGCGGVYSSNDITIMAVSPTRYREWPCGTRVQVCGPAGCIVVTRQDACPGCYANLVDLSEAGNAAVCGSPPHTCRVTLQLVSRP